MQKALGSMRKDTEHVGSAGSVFPSTKWGGLESLGRCWGVRPWHIRKPETAWRVPPTSDPRMLPILASPSQQEPLLTLILVVCPWNVIFNLKRHTLQVCYKIARPHSLLFNTITSTLREQELTSSDLRRFAAIMKLVSFNVKFTRSAGSCDWRLYFSNCPVCFLPSSSFSNSPSSFSLPCHSKKVFLCHPSWLQTHNSPASSAMCWVMGLHHHFRIPLITH